LRLTGQAVSNVELAGVPRTSGRIGNGFIGQGPIAGHARALSTSRCRSSRGAVSARTSIPGQPVRFHYPVDAFDPEGGIPGVFIDSTASSIPS
jgi:hypothetical protein